MTDLEVAAPARKAARRTSERDGFYRTPAIATEMLLQVERFGPRIWEPACGDGAISRVLEQRGHEVVSMDLVDRGYGTPGRDFLLEWQAAAPDIVMNPPFHLMDDFVLHALGLGVGKVAAFGRLAWLEGQRRHASLWSKHPPARIWVISKRLTLWRGDDPDPKDSGGAIPFCWVVWERGHAGKTLGWLA